METLQTEIFKMKRFDFAMEMVSVYGKPWIILESVLLILSLTAAVFIDLRWAVFFLMLLFILTPAMLIFLYYYHGLRPECVVNVMDHRFTFNENLLVVTLFRKCDDTDIPLSEQYQPSSTIQIEYSCFSSYNVRLNSVTIPLRKDKKGFLWIPLTAFSNPIVFNKAIERIIKGIRESSESRNV